METKYLNLKSDMSSAFVKPKIVLHWTIRACFQTGPSQGLAITKTKSF